MKLNPGIAALALFLAVNASVAQGATLYRMETKSHKVPLYSRSGTNFVHITNDFVGDVLVCGGGRVNRMTGERFYYLPRSGYWLPNRAFVTGSHTPWVGPELSSCEQEAEGGIGPYSAFPRR